MAKNDTLVNGLSPVTQKSGGKVITGPDFCKTPTPGGPVPIPYPNIAKSADLAKGSKRVKINGAPVCLNDSNFSTSTGDEAGSAGGGVASGKTKGRAHPVNYSFDVKINGKPVVRNLDLFTGNDRNTPPAPIVQSQPAPVAAGAMEEKKEKCPYCDNDKHDFADQWGSNIGSSAILANNIFKDNDKDSHPWHSGPFSLQAHHVICSEAMDSEDWAELCRHFGYNINHQNNGVMLPYSMALACQLHAPVHRGGHAKGWADDLHLPYPDAVKKKIKEVADAIEAGEFCGDLGKAAKKLDKISKQILVNIDKFKWTITADGKDYQKGGCGCAGVDSITGKPKQPCVYDRCHDLKQAKTTQVIGVKNKPLTIGE